jgi:dipeptidyl aminopeptidase/acylaminoacyl peptidase
MRIFKAILLASAGLTTLSAPVFAQTQKPTEVVVRGEKRVKPTDAPPSLELYAKMPHLEEVAMSPDGERVAFMTRIGSIRVLGAYNFADKSHQIFTLKGGPASALSWADNAHVLISDSRLALRGTCENAPSAPGMSNNARDMPLPDSVKAGSADAAALQAQMQQLLDAIQPPGCAYFGVRVENAITSLNVLTGKAAPIGFHIGDAPSMPLGLPSRVTVDGKPRLMGGFLEVRAHSVGNQPAQRAYLWKVDPETGDARLVDDHGGDIERENHYVDDWLFDSDGSLVARSVYDFRSRAFRIEMRDQDRWKTVLSRPIVAGDATFAPYLIGVSGDDGSIVILDTDTHGADRKGAARHFHYYSLKASGELSGPLEKGEASQARPVFSPQTGRLAGFAYTAEEPHYEIADPGLRDLYDRAVSATSGQTAAVLSVSDDESKALIRVTGGEDTGSYYRLDYQDHQVDTIGEDYPLIPTPWIASQEILSYAAKDGTNIDAVLTLPPKPAGKNLPLVVLPHDGPQGMDRIGFDWLAQALASRGYLVLQPNYRGSEGYGADFIAAGYGQWDGRMLSDIDAGVAEVVRQGLADPTRVCMIGVGFGGYAALKAAEDGTVRCAASIDGVTDTASYLAWRQARTPSPDPDAFASLTPSAHWPRTFEDAAYSLRKLSLFVGADRPAIDAAHVRAPVLLIHQSGDRLVPDSQSRKLNDALQAAGKPVDYVELKGVGHTPDTEATRLAVLQSLTAFLAKYNP